MRVLIVSENMVLMRNLKEWFSNKIERGDLILDHAASKDEAEKLMDKNNYDKIFHNGIFIIDSIERLQAGSEVWYYGNPNNTIYKNTIKDISNRKYVSRAFKGKIFQISANIGGIISVITILAYLITFVVTVKADVDTNKKDIIDIKSVVKTIDEQQKDLNINMDKIITAFKIVYGEKIDEVFKDK